MSVEPLFEPFTIKAPAGSITLPNRIVMAPMTRAFSPGGIPGPGMAEYYRRRAVGGVGLIITEGVGIDRPASRSDSNVPNLFGDATQKWRHIVEEVHAAGGLIAPQLWHVGAKRGQGENWAPLGQVDSPSGIDVPGTRIYDPLTEEGIADILSSYENSARCARDAGFDAVEIHAAHGYLIDQFFWRRTNERADSWNGPGIRERSRFGAEVIRAVRRGAGESLPIIMRISQWKLQDYSAKNASSPDELSQWIEPLAEAGADVFHCSQRRFWDAEFPGSPLSLTGWVRKLSGLPAITVGSVGLDGEFMAGLRGESSQPASLRDLLERFATGEFDLVAVGRALLADPHWIEKIRLGRTSELKHFDRSMLATLT